MSKLFKALESLERHAEAQSQEALHVKPVLTEISPNQVYFKIALIVLICIALGAAIGGLAWSYKKKVGHATPINRKISIQAVQQTTGPLIATDAEQPSTSSGGNIPAAPLQINPGQDSEAHIPPKSVSQGVGHSLGEHEIPSLDHHISEEMLNQKAFPASNEDSTHPSSLSDTKKYILTKKSNEKVVQNFVPKKSDAQPAITEIVEDKSLKAKKLIYQAESALKQNNSTLAIQFLQSSWDLVKNPAVANNLAALLIQQKKDQEALTIIDQALRLTPNDQDLLYNRQLIQEHK